MEQAFLELLLAADQGQGTYPTAYKQKQGLKTPQATPENPSQRHQTTVRKILERRENTGCIVNFKTFTNSIGYIREGSGVALESPTQIQDR